MTSAIVVFLNESTCRSSFTLRTQRRPTHPKETLLKGQYKALSPGLTRVVAVLHEAAHYAVLEIYSHNKKVDVYDGLYRDLDR